MKIPYTNSQQCAQYVENVLTATETKQNVLHKQEILVLTGQVISSHYQIILSVYTCECCNVWKYFVWKIG